MALTRAEKNNTIDVSHSETGGLPYVAACFVYVRFVNKKRWNAYGIKQYDDVQ